MNRRLLAALALLVLLGTAGCTTILGDDAGDPEALSADAEYDYDTDRDAFIRVNRGNYTAVYNVSAKVTGDNGTIELYRTNALTIENPLELEALQFRYANGTVVRYVDGEAVLLRSDGTQEPTDALAVETTRQRTVVELPAEEGQIAFTTPKSGKEIAVYTPVHGSYEVALPPDRDASVPLLSRTRPSNDDRAVVGDRVRLRWDNVETSVLSVRWYLDRDLWLFGGLAVVGAILGAAGIVYYYRSIRMAEKRRDEAGLDVDTGDDDREGPPPGMR
ncbi:uncharacterized protein Nmlp_2771 [Natronomonas moolapensis 8.8.11]|uniref:Uncharacterized protein n=1 Tax=Natronomonas moolapensis (strain DSM 18674 / CECT 7526 / JCM 14361 / 8.8.11) TaxID=268739 RepID=M1XRM7_NATM8|nr:DUF5803 family protein [Natronomonas moolapensis]CCQ36924.1 uncharacterized protein Nmlp_2771 [Natronomonas moolapensis 8.8.11]